MNSTAEKIANTHLTFTQAFPELPIRELLGRILGDEMYKEWSQRCNVLAHRVTTAGSTTQYQIFFQSVESPISVTQWASDFSLDATTTVSRYNWLRETINGGLEEAAAFTVQQLAYAEDRLRRLAW